METTTLVKTANCDLQHPLPPLYVDLDGTLIRSDLLIELALRFVVDRPWQFWRLPMWLLAGRATLKARLSEQVELDVARLPYASELLEYLRQQREAGRRIVLATASHERWANRIASFLGLFDAVIASDAAVNRKGTAKLEAIRQHAIGAFSYAGNEAVDLAIWREAATGVVVNATTSVRAAASALTCEERNFSGPTSGLRVWLKAIRLHHWAKNTLLVAPALPIIGSLVPGQWLALAIAFLCFGACASSVYLVNDLLDLDADRAHPRKRHRPFASGSLSLQQGIVAAVALLVFAFAIAIVAMPMVFVATLAVYWVSTLAYSLVLKRRILVDVLMLAGLYTLRIIAGAAAIQVMPSFWILSFSMFLFLSLGSVKRYVELREILQSEGQRTKGRGYFVSDLPFVQSIGMASGLVSVLVMAMYINDPATIAHFPYAKALWGICPLILYWVCRVWLKASRDELHDDPVVFAVSDRVSQLIGLAVLCVVGLAAFAR